MRGWRVGIVVAVLVLVAGGGVAAAHHDGHEFGSSQECMASGTGIHHVPTCTRSGDGPWIAQYGPLDSGGSGNVFDVFGVFLIFALLWGVAPAVIAGWIASDRGQSVGLAVILGIALGWIGLVIVIVAFKPDVTAAAQNVIDRAARGSGETPDLPVRDVKSRLEELDRLKRERLITEQEYATRRSAILNEI